jgi:hypothetical protein
MLKYRIFRLEKLRFHVFSHIFRHLLGGKTCRLTQKAFLFGLAFQGWCMELETSITLSICQPLLFCARTLKSVLKLRSLRQFVLSSFLYTGISVANVSKP